MHVDVVADRPLATMQCRTVQGDLHETEDTQQRNPDTTQAIPDHDGQKHQSPERSHSTVS